MTRPTRRGLLLAAGGLVASLAGCLGGDEGDGEGTDGGDAPSVTANPPVEGPTVTAASDGESIESATAATGTDGEATASGDLDLREANVTAVAVEPVGDGRYEFSVTLLHDDDGEEGYANWWQVETLDGEQLGRRELLHAHGTQEFTRSETVAVPDGGCVVVRGHDQTHGYGGQAIVVDVETGATRVFPQGPERGTATAEQCP